MVFERLRDGRLSLDDTFSVSETAWRKGGAKSGSSTMFLVLGDRVRVEPGRGKHRYVYCLTRAAKRMLNQEVVVPWK
ncbi:hypothetical protein LCGC14_1999770 [marine sediment metagenome]|uniref:Uncharacterized protein n=1 Tax=marine sediment metagenome TaxID=412755 RepID=A0A0F9HH05_9ZZZZ